MTKFINFNSIGDSSSSIMSRIQQAGSGLTSSSMMIIVIAIIIFVSISAAAYAYYFYYILPGLRSSYRPNKEHVPNDSAQKDAELLFFYADWCPHCKTAKPVWEELKSEYENKTINGYRVIFTEINCTTENAEVEQMMNKYNIEGFPTIKLLKDGQIIEYDAKPTKATLDQFLNTVL